METTCSSKETLALDSLIKTKDIFHVIGRCAFFKSGSFDYSKVGKISETGKSSKYTDSAFAYSRKAKFLWPGTQTSRTSHTCCKKFLRYAKKWTTLRQYRQRDSLLEKSPLIDLSVFSFIISIALQKQEQELKAMWPERGSYSFEHSSCIQIIWCM